MEVLPTSAIDVCEESRWVFIVGAPRCGTTSLSRYLAGHPDVYFSKVKEPHYFAGADLQGLPDRKLRLRILNEYLGRYFPQRRSAPVLAEGSVTYLYVPEKMLPILRLWPKAKFIIGLRNPLTMIPSLHQRLCFNGDETVRDFAEAWALVPERRQGRAIPRSCADPRWLDYWEAGQIGKYVEQFLDFVGRERCFVYLFDDFAADPAQVYGDILGFLRLNHDHRRDYPTHREGRDYKIGWLQRALKRPPRSLMTLGGELYRSHFQAGPKRESGRLAKAVLAARLRVLAWNRAPAPRMRIDPALRSEMVAIFNDDIARLGEILGRDLSHWLDESDAIFTGVAERQTQSGLPRRAAAYRSA
jgi:hypothetical protein